MCLKRTLQCRAQQLNTNTVKQKLSWAQRCKSSLLVFCCSSRSMTPITETHHRHLLVCALLKALSIPYSQTTWNSVPGFVRTVFQNASSPSFLVRLSWFFNMMVPYQGLPRESNSSSRIFDPGLVTSLMTSSMLAFHMAISLQRIVRSTSCLILW